MSKPKIGTIARLGTMADRTAIAVEVGYDNEDSNRLIFNGPAQGVGPVVMIQPNGDQTFVTEPGRHGDFGIEWVRRFFS